MIVTSGFNAIAHAVEALYSEQWNPVTEYLAIQGTRSIVTALPRILENPSDKEGRAQALFGAWACGTCLAQASMGLHHKLCHLLG
jgi:maleylacetate reductase